MKCIDLAYFGYFDFIQKFTSVLDKIAPKKCKVKNNSQEWFDKDVAEQIAIRDKTLNGSKNKAPHR